MAGFRSDFMQVVHERGFVHQCSDPEALDARCAAGIVPAYVGFDCTADSLHVGHLLSIMTLRWLQKTGHKPITLMGGGTTKVGDPSGKDEARKLLSYDEIARNMASIKRVFERFVRFGDAPRDAVMPDNAEWLDRLNYVEFLRDYGRHFSVNRMLSFDSVKMRLEREQPLSFLEFNYMILQSYDFLELARRYGCCLQMGGSDQWGNIVSGVELGRRTDGLELFALTTPLLTTASGAKMGKTATGAMWLNADRMTPWEYWQFWRNTEDGDVGRFLRLFTDLPLDEIVKLESLGGSEINEAKKVLANETTTLLHGAAEAAKAAETARRTFEAGEVGEGLPTITVARADLAVGILAYRLLAQAGLAASNSEARRLIQQKGASINNLVIADESEPVTLAHLVDGTIKLSRGGKRHALVRIRD